MTTKTKIKINPKKVRMTLVALVVATFLLRLVLTNMSASQTYELAQNTTVMKDLDLQHEQLMLSVAELRSIEHLSQVSNALSLVKTDKIYYLQARGSVAFNR